MAFWRRWLPVVSVLGLCAWTERFWWLHAGSTDIDLVDVPAFQIQAQDSRELILPTSSVYEFERDPYVMIWEDDQLKKMSVEAQRWRAGYYRLTGVPAGVIIMLGDLSTIETRVQPRLLNNTVGLDEQ